MLQLNHVNHQNPRTVNLPLQTSPKEKGWNMQGPKPHAHTFSGSHCGKQAGSATRGSCTRTLLGSPCPMRTSSPSFHPSWKWTEGLCYPNSAENVFCSSSNKQGFRSHLDVPVIEKQPTGNPDQFGKGGGTNFNLKKPPIWQRPMSVRSPRLTQRSKTSREPKAGRSQRLRTARNTCTCQNGGVGVGGGGWGGIPFLGRPGTAGKPTSSTKLPNFDKALQVDSPNPRSRGSLLTPQMCPATWRGIFRIA